jgi:glycine/D-amino acid oxidase-like deaminating enzyme
VAVVGAGIVGASVAYHLARRGVPVTLLDQAPSPGAGVTGSSFAWIGGTGGDWPGGAEDLRAAVLSDYRRLEGEVPGLAVRWTGSLAWGRAADQPDDRARPPLPPGRQWVGRGEIAALEPHLRTLPARAVSTPTDGGVDPVRMTEALVDAARALGARVVLGGGAVSLTVGGGRLEGVVSPAGFVPASTVVLAAGTGTAALCAPLGIEVAVAASPAVLMHVEAPRGLVRTIIATPEYEVREGRDGHLLVTAPHDGDTSGPALERLAQRTLVRLRSSFGAPGPLRLLGCGVGWRPMPAGGPLVGYVTRDRSVYVAVMHSAVTLAPTVGRLVAGEIASGVQAVELRRCRPRGSAPPGSG